MEGKKRYENKKTRVEEDRERGGGGRRSGRKLGGWGELEYTY